MSLICEFSLGDAVVRVTRELLDRYVTSGPRYTSYPTVPSWSADFGEAEYRRALHAADSDTRSLYIHIPFCRRRCYYCGCNACIPADRSEVDEYVAALIAEIGRLAEASAGSGTDRPLVQIHWGGGTPTTLSDAQFTAVMSAVRDAFPVAPDAEIGIEVDPRVTSPATLDHLAGLGFNRLSLGVQDLNDDVQRAVGRVQPVELTRKMIVHGRSIGFQSVNIDLIYGLPLQTAERWQHTLAGALELAPDRVALFNFAHLPARFPHQQQIDASQIPGPDAKLQRFGEAITTFTANGYRFIGLDHFARRDDELSVAHHNRTLHRNFMGYSTHAGADLLAVGASAISGLCRAYAQNDHDPSRYCDAVGAGRLPTIRGLIPTADDRLRRDLITRLLCHDRVHRSELCAAHPAQIPTPADFDVYFAPDLGRLQPCIADGLAADDGEAIRVTPTGRLFVRNLAMCFDARLHAGDGGTFSKTL
jgi:oxygen-independent coproporphyrinogen-3 oxidase